MPKTRLHINVKKKHVPESGGASLPKKPHLDPKPDGHQGSRKSVKGAHITTTDSRKKGRYGECCSRCDSIQNHHHHLHLLDRLVPFLYSGISGEALLPIGFCLIW